MQWVKLLCEFVNVVDEKIEKAFHNQFLLEGQGKPSRYKHLGAAGTSAHVDGVMMVIRRNQIDELQKSALVN